MCAEKSNGEYITKKAGHVSVVMEMKQALS